MASYQVNPLEILDTTNSIGVGSGGSLTIGGGISIGRDTYIGGNINVLGASASFADNIIILNNNTSGTTDTGILLKRGTEDITGNNNFSGIIYSETSDSFKFGYVTADTRGTLNINSLVPIETSGLTTGNINFTGSLYQNGALFTGTSQWSTGGSNSIFYTSGNVGINTTAPGATLDVAGNIRLGIPSTVSSGNIILQNDGTGVTFQGAKIYKSYGSGLTLVPHIDGSGISFRNATDTTTVTRIDGLGNISSGSVSAINSTITNAVHTTLTSGAIVLTGGSLNATFNSNIVGNIFTTGGNVGIGQGNPSTALSIFNGGMNVGGVNSIITQGAHIQWNRSGGEGESWIINQKGMGGVNSGIRFGTSNATNNVIEWMRIIENGNVGINNTSPTYKLDITGTLRATGGDITTATLLATTSISSGSIQGTNSTITNAVHTTLTSGAIVLTGGSLNATFNSNTVGALTTTGGNVGVGTVTPSYKMDIVGSLRATSGDITVGTLLATTTIRATTSISSASLQGLNSTITNAVSTNTTIQNSIITALSSGNIYFTGNLYKNGVLFAGGSSQWGNGLSGSIYYTGGNVGIGTMFPGSLLHIASTSQNTATGGVTLITLERPGVSGTTYPSYVDFNVHRYSQVSSDAWTQLDLNLSNGQSVGRTNVMTLRGNGNVGIGTTAPGYKLDVVGSANFTANLLATNISGGNISAGNLTVGTFNTAKMNVSHTSNNLITGGIALLTLNRPGAVNQAYDSSVDFNIHRYSNVNYAAFTQLDINLTNGLSSDRTNVMTLRGNGNVGIGTTAPAYQLHLSSDSAAKPSTNTWTVSSDMRLKTNIQLADLDMCYNTIKSIPLKKYTWRDDVYTTEEVPDRSKLGWIAQDVEQVIPKAVEQKEMFGYSDCRTLNSDQLIASLYGTVQKLMMTFEQLRDEIEILKGGEKLFTQFTQTSIQPTQPPQPPQPPQSPQPPQPQAQFVNSRTALKRVKHKLKILF